MKNVCGGKLLWSDLRYCPRVSCERQETYSKPADNLYPGQLINTGQKSEI